MFILKLYKVKAKHSIHLLCRTARQTLAFLLSRIHIFLINESHDGRHRSICFSHALVKIQNFIATYEYTYFDFDFAIL